MSSTTNIVTSTANSSELAHYSYLSRVWWKDDGTMTCLHQMDAIRVPWVVNTLIELGIANTEFVNTEKPLQGLLILDAGCGGGYVTEALARYGCTIVGLDIGFEILEVAKQHAALDPSLTNITYVHQCIEEHAEKNNEKYDAVIAFEVLAHMNEPEIFLESCVKCLKPDRPIFISTFNKTIASFLLGIIFAEYIWGFIPRRTHNWFRFHDPRDIERMLAKHNCKVREIRGQLYNFFTKTWYWSSIQVIKYAMYAVKNK